MVLRSKWLLALILVLGVVGISFAQSSNVVATARVWRTDYNLTLSSQGYTVSIVNSEMETEEEVFTIDWALAEIEPTDLVGLSVVPQYEGQQGDPVILVWNSERAYLIEHTEAYVLTVTREFDITARMEMLELLQQPFMLKEPCAEGVTLSVGEPFPSENGDIIPVRLICESQDFGLRRSVQNGETYSISWGFDPDLTVLQPSDNEQHTEILQDGSEVLFMTGAAATSVRCESFEYELDFNGELSFEANCNDKHNNVQVYFIPSLGAFVTVVAESD